MLTIRAGSTAYPLCLPYDGCPRPQLTLADYHPGFYAEPYPLPPRTKRVTPSWNVIEWPVWGATRYAEGHLLVDGETWASLRAELPSDGAVTVAYDDGVGGTGELKLYVVAHVPVSDSRVSPSSSTAGNGEVLYHLLVSDARYLASEPPVVNAASASTWGNLIATLLQTAFGWTTSASALDALIDADYGTPGATWAYSKLLGRSAACVLDAALAAVSLRALFKHDGTVLFQTATAAATVSFPHAADLHSGGFVSLAEERAGSLSIVPYTWAGTSNPVTRGVSGGTAPRIVVWLPYSTTAAQAQYAADYAAWTTGDVPNGYFAGFLSMPSSALLDRWILDHDRGVTGFVTGVTGYPWPLVGSLSVSDEADRLVNACLTRDGYGNVTGLRLSWLKPDGTVVCEDVADCPTCTSPPPPPASPPPPPASPPPPPLPATYDVFVYTDECSGFTPSGYNYTVSCPDATPSTATITADGTANGIWFYNIPWGTDTSVTLTTTSDTWNSVGSLDCGGGTSFTHSDVATVNGSACDNMVVAFSIGGCGPITPPTAEVDIPVAKSPPIPPPP